MSADSPLTTVLAGGSVIRTGAGWWLASAAGAVRVADRELCAELDSAAAAMEQADRAVAALRPGIGDGQ